MNSILIDDLLKKYWDSDTSLEEERVIKEYFSHGKVAEKHLQYAPLFSFFEVEKTSKIDLSLEKILKDSVKSQNKNKGRWIGLPRYIITVAASIALLVSTVFIFNHYNNLNGYSYVAVEGQVEELESEEALQIAEDALMFLSGKLSKSSHTVKESMVAAKRGKLFY